MNNNGFSKEALSRMKRMSDLAQSFATLKDHPYRDQIGIDPWDPNRLETWALGPEPGNSARHVVRFLLSLWNPHVEWRCGWFDMHIALSVWDGQHRGAFANWAKEPWWP